MISLLPILFALPVVLAETEVGTFSRQEPVGESSELTASSSEKLLRTVFSRVVPTGWVSPSFKLKLWSVGYSAVLGEGKVLYSIRYDSPGGHLGPFPFKQSYLVYCGGEDIQVALGPSEYFILVKQLAPALLSLKSDEAFLALADSLPISSGRSSAEEYSHSISLNEGVVKIVREGPFCQPYSTERSVPVTVELVLTTSGCVSLSVAFNEEGRMAFDLLEESVYSKKVVIESIQWDRRFGKNVGPYYPIVKRKQIPTVESSAESVEIQICKQGVVMFSRGASARSGANEIRLHGINHSVSSLGFYGWFTAFPFVSLKAIETFFSHASPSETRGLEWAIQGSYELGAAGLSSCSKEHWSKSATAESNTLTWSPGEHFHGNPWGTQNWVLEFEKDRLKRVTAKW